MKNSETDAPPPASRWFRGLPQAGPVVAWGTWLAMTILAIAFTARHTRNVPVLDDFALVGVMTSHEQVSLAWAWERYNEHRMLAPKLILAYLTRLVGDIRAGMFLNGTLLSAATASMLMLARRLRGRTAVTDAALPVAILNLGQFEVLLCSLALNLVLTGWVAYALLRTVSLVGQLPGWRVALRAGFLLVLLPLCGGSGLVMVPPLALWLAGYVCWGWWSSHRVGGATRAIGVVSLMACSAVVALSLNGYSRPPGTPPMPSLAAAAETTMQFIGAAFCPDYSVDGRISPRWWLAALGLGGLIAATLLLVVIVAARTPAERPRALGLAAVLLAVLCIAAAVGVSRSGFGPGTGFASRYVSMSVPLICGVYLAWLAYGSRPAQRAVHSCLLAATCLMLVPNIRCAWGVGEYRRAQLVRVERGIEHGAPMSRLVPAVSPGIHPLPHVVELWFRQLKEARIGEFKHLIDDRMATAPGRGAEVR